MKHADERVAMQAVEFWSTVCQEEVDLAIEAEEVSNRSFFIDQYLKLFTRLENTATHLNKSRSSLPK